MTQIPLMDVEFDDEAEDQDIARQVKPGSIAAVLSGTDWTAETIVSQLKRGNILLNPRFQRRDAWKRDRKSRFIESLIVGLPIPQIVLAESKDDRGKFIVLDGKQRLLSMLQFWGLGQGEDNQYALSGLPLRPDLKQKTFSDLSSDPALEGDFNSLCNQSIRTIVIRNWKDTDFLHTVFLRLNTGSVRLSPQELRQALLPGPFTDYVDEAAASSPGLRQLLGLAGPDPRMRDIEILSRFLAFRFYANEYPGRMKSFLDTTFGAFNAEWKATEPAIRLAVADFEAGADALIRIFKTSVARKPGSSQFNRAVFDALIYFQSLGSVRKLLRGKDAEIRKAYLSLFAPGSQFLTAVERDTAGAPNTSTRLVAWAAALSLIAGRTIVPPAIPIAAASKAGVNTPPLKAKSKKTPR